MGRRQLQKLIVSGKGPFSVSSSYLLDNHFQARMISKSDKTYHCITQYTMTVSLYTSTICTSTFCLMRYQAFHQIINFLVLDCSSNNA